jgi:hypothetical protein
MATISIIIQGIAICYQKEIEGKTVWRILFPFNHCHTVKFEYEKGADKVFVGHLGTPKSRVEVTMNGATSASSTEEFDNQVLDLTTDTVIRTHSKIALKSGWDERGVLLTIPSIVFDVRDTLLDFPENRLLDEIFLHNPDGPTEQILYDKASSAIVLDVAHSITGRIQLKAGEALSVKIDENTIFTTEPNTNYTLIFDNDCDEIEELPDGTYRNDMEMIYTLFQDTSHANRKFLVEARANLSIPPNLLQGKPCLVVKVTDPISVQDLP